MTQLVGIVNITPDSFSDGGRYDTVEAAYHHSEQLLKSGADVLDIGAESTRPGATPLSPKQEKERLQDILPSLVKLARKYNAAISLDTRHALTAEYALSLEVDWINDVSAGASDDLLACVAQSACRYVFMHALTIPADKSVTLPRNTSIPRFLYDFFDQ